ncbi:DeoR/GlpR family DNA-binding transcription regulator [Vibrio salinus]|uniref:DeoR/GlpR family DNA-binding transcription regulator n=1 Tax=Vibrio salinus TaxID=2899784 RepID=UPI001E3B1155|nr:DeoR/GlpR family DNA-binding transcription regulator [Vibrio salinus]MCE0494741.1 DeoR/GlpR family DNA-binding transcription regulator [Vibrio salinus]
MIPAERHRAILSALTEQPIISITELVNILDVSHMTIRRDIAKLEKSGKVISISGGVKLPTQLHEELPHSKKITERVHQKEQIGKLAADQVQANTTIYLDAGTTSLEVAKQLANRDDLIFITNDFPIATYLMNNSQSKIYHTGGLIDRANQSAVGSKVSDFLYTMNIDIAFISTSSWNMKGISTPSENKVIVKKTITEVANKCYLISDSSKFGKVAPFHALPIGVFHYIISDLDLPAQIVEDLQKRGIDVIRPDMT